MDKTLILLYVLNIILFIINLWRWGINRKDAQTVEDMLTDLHEQIKIDEGYYNKTCANLQELEHREKHVGELLKHCQTYLDKAK